MKNALLFFLLLANSFLFAQEAWHPLGADDFTEVSNITATQARIAIDNNNVPYMAYIDGDNANKATVRKFNGTAWEVVGVAGFSEGEVYALPTTYGSPNPIQIDIAIDSNNVPYVVYSDAANANKATVQKFNGTAWEVAGTAGFSAGSTLFMNISIGTDNVPYVAFSDAGIYDMPLVWRFNGTGWVGLDLLDFGPSSGRFLWVSMALNSNNEPYLAFFNDEITPDGGIGRKWNEYDMHWEWLDVVPFFTSYPWGLSMALNTNNVAYVVYGKATDIRKATIKKFNGTTWEQVGADGISDNEAFYTDIVIGSNNVPYVVYQNGPSSVTPYRVMVKKFNGTVWEEVGTTGGLSAPPTTTGITIPAAYSSIVIDGNNVPYVAYISEGKVYAKYYGTETLSTNDNVFSLTKTNIYPNPVASTFSISGNEFVEEIAIYNVMGKKVLHEKQVNQAINIEHLSKGIYLAKIKTENGTTSVNLIKE